MNGVDEDNNIERLYRLLTSREPRDLKAHLARVEFGRPMVPGTTLPALGAVEYQATSSGLFIPKGAMESIAPIDLLRTFITPDELVGRPFSLETAWLHIRKIPLDEVVGFVSSTLSRWRNPEFTDAENDDYFARLWFEGEALRKVLGLLRQKSRSLVAPQALLVMLKMALMVNDVLVSRDGEVGNLVVALLAVMQNLGVREGGMGDREANQIVSDTPGDLGREIISNQLFNSSIEERGVLARFVRRWREMPVEYAGDPRVVDVAQTYREVTGVDIEDLSIVGLAIIGAAWNGRTVVNRSYFASLSWSEDRVSRTLGLISCDIAKLRDLVVAETAERGMEWSFSAFERFPILRISESDYLILDPLLVVRRIFGWTPVYDVTSLLDGEGSRESRRRASRFTNCIRHLAEKYAIEVIDSIVQGGNQVRVYKEEKIQSAYGRKGVRLADCAIDYGDSWIILEVTSSRLTRESVSGVSDGHVVADMEKLVEKVEQIDSTIKAIVDDQNKLTNSPGLESQRFFPVLVVTEGFPVNPVSLEILRTRVARAGYLQRPGVAPLEVVDIAELELIEAVHENYGITFRELCEAKATSNLFRASMRDYVIVERRMVPNFARRIDKLCEKAFQPALDALAESSDIE